MNAADLRLEHVQSLELAHYTRWLNSLLERPDPRTADRVSADLRTAVATRHDELSAAEDLVRRRYAWRGYLSASHTGLIAPPALNCVTLLAQVAGKLAGTLTVRPDSTEGLLAEGTYPDAIDELRAEGRRVGELTKLAIEEGAAWRVALQGLVRSAYVVTRTVHRLTDVVIEVNPRHVRFYSRVFGFVSAAAERVCTRVGAPSVLMLLDLEAFGRRCEGGAVSALT